MAQSSKEKKTLSRTEKNRQRRRFVFELLFAAQFYEEQEVEDLLKAIAEDEDLLKELREDGLSEEDSLALRQKALGIMQKRAELDQQINEQATGWKTNRMGKPELTLIRQALYDMQYDEAIPCRVAINEAVELAKTYGGEDAPAFVNAVLGKLAAALNLDA